MNSAIQALQGGNEADAQRAYAEIAEMARLDAAECAPILMRALLEEKAGGQVRTPRLLTLLGLTRQPLAECLPLCLELLRNGAGDDGSLPADALIGAAAVIARTEPRALLPDVGQLAANEQVPADDGSVARVLLPLLSLTGRFLRELPDNAVTEMVRRLWADCAALDLMTLADVVGLHVEFVGANDEVIELFVDLAERVRAKPDEKKYAASRLAEAGVGPTSIAQLENAWRAIAVAPANVPEEDAWLEPLDPQPPAPDPRIDEWLATFSEGNDQNVELARAALDMMFDEPQPPFALTWWVAVTADASPPWRRREDIRWALLRASIAVRGLDERISNVPPSVLLRWLDSPQLLDQTSTWAALDLLGRQRPDVLVRHCLHRAVAASNGEHPEIALGEMWDAAAKADPAAVLLLVSRWVALGFGKSPLLPLLIGRLISSAQERPALVDELAQVVSSTEHAPNVADVARQLLDGLRDAPNERPA